jgi:hypothetical protein
MDQARFDTRNLFCHLFLPLKIYCLVPQRAENQRMLFKFGGPLGEPTEPLVNQRPKILFKILVKTNEPLAFPYTACCYDAATATWTRHFASGTVVTFDAGAGNGTTTWAGQ